MKKILLTFTAILVATFQIYSAYAHAFVTDSYPKASEKVSSIPARVWVEFDGNLATIEGHTINKLYLYDSKGNRLDDGSFLTGGARLSVGLKTQASGIIRMAYRVVSEDGHPVEGEVVFTSNYINLNQENSASKSPTPKSKKTLDAQNQDKSGVIAKPSPIDTPKNLQESPETLLKEHGWHLIQFLFVAILIFIWSRFRQRRDL